jgi:murein L,D-transpeptidase YcbB/YkuD
LLPGLAAVLLPALIALPALAAADALLRERLATLGGEAAPAIGEVALAAVPVLDDFYRQRGYEYAWREDHQLSGLRRLVERSRESGLSPSSFNLEEVEALLGGGSPESLSGESRVSAEILLSDSLLRVIHHHQFGKVDPQSIDESWNHAEGPTAARLATDLGRALAAGDLEAEVVAMWRQPAFYSRLKEGLAQYRKLASAGGWPRVPDGPLLRPGMSDARVPVIRERLRVTGDYAGGGGAEPRHYDAALERAVRAFQARHTLGVDGVVGPATLAAMNVSAEQRVDQIRANLERMRWVGGTLTGDYLLVDIAAQEVELYRDGKPSWSSRAIVGRPERQTPVFRDRVEYLELNPTWTVPPTILKEDVLPKARRDPGAVREKGLEVIDHKGNRVAPEDVDWTVAHDRLPYMLRQPPGPENALGQVKFMFPNRHSVYLHDTPSRNLFGKAQRAFSSGCVRVERPFELAELLLDDPKWTQSRFSSLIETKRPTTVHLKRPVPVILSYWTAEGDEEGMVRFREDIYGRDASVLAALERPGPMRVVYDDTPEGPAGPGSERVAEVKPEPQR